MEPMNEELRRQIGLFKYKLICPLLAETSRNRNAYSREVSQKEQMFPGAVRPMKVAVSTLKGWLKVYNQRVIDGERNDKGRLRRLKEQELSAIRVKCRALFPNLTAQKLCEDFQLNDQFGHFPICYNTLLRIISKDNLLPTGSRKDPATI
jgi:hypothetical protein